VDSSRYADLFLTEGRDHLSVINHCLLQLEQRSGGAEVVDALFRAVHSVKGMSATMGYAPVAELCHELETLLDGVRRGERRITSSVMDVLFRSADALERALELCAAGKASEVDVAAPVARLRDAAAPPATGPAPVAGPVAPAGSSRASAEAVGDAGAWAAPAPAGDGTLVRVRLADGTPLKGVRAYMVVEKLKTLGAIGGLSPAADRLQADDFALDFAVRLGTAASAEEIERVARAAGFVEQVAVGEAAERVAEGGAEAGAAAAPAPAPAARGAAGGGWSGTASEFAPQPRQRHIRVDLRRLDALTDLIGELVVTRGRLTQLAAALHDPGLADAVAQASRLIGDLQDEIMTSRMVPVWQVFDRFPRFVRDAARALGKQVEFAVEGKEIELDRSMLDEIGDPVVHLLRNAVDHGIESPEARVAAGKPPAGRLTLSAARDRSAVVIRVEDDGRGIDQGRVLERARELGLVDGAKSELSDEELFKLVARPGFSTAAEVTDISGRGVGVDAVHSRVRALGGSVEMRSAPGRGTTVTLRLPVTLAIVRALLAQAADERYAIPLTHVSETAELDPAAVRTVRGREVLVVREEVMPLLRLRSLVQLGDADAPEARARAQVVLLEAGERRAALVVDQLAGQQEIVVKQFDALRGGQALFSGATILGDGQPALILDVGSLL
jgi:two-component system, chemotaxis family, sensor kinase CheA